MKAAHIISAIAAAAVMSAATVPAFAADEQEYVAFTAIKSTIGQGFTTEPVLVPIYEGDTGIDVVKRAADVQVIESDYGAYINAFADADLGTDVPAEITAVCPEMTGRTADGYLSALDYTTESGWSYFVNGEYAQVGIADYQPQDGDVLEFRLHGGCKLTVRPSGTEPKIKFYFLLSGSDLPDTQRKMALYRTSLGV